MLSPADTMSGLVSDTIIGGTTGWNVKIGKLVSEPDQVAVFYDTGGSNPNPRWQVDWVTVQCIIRGKPHDYSTAWAKARAIRDALLGLPSQTIDGDRWVSIIVQGDIGFINYDDKERPTFSVNFRIIIEPEATQDSNRDPL